MFSEDEFDAAIAEKYNLKTCTILMKAKHFLSTVHKKLLTLSRPMQGQGVHRCSRGEFCDNTDAAMPGIEHEQNRAQVLTVSILQE